MSYEEKGLVESTLGPDESELALERIREWAVDATGRDTRSVEGVLCTETVRAFRGVARHAERRDDLPKSNRHSLKKACDTLTLWASGYGVHEGGLDKALATSWSLQRSVLEVMVSIGTLLLHKLVPLLEQRIAVDVDPIALKKAMSDASGVLLEGLKYHRRRGPESDTDSDSSSDLSDSEGDEIESIIQNVDVSVQCLLDLEPLINGHVKNCKLLEVPYSEASVVTFNPLQIFTNSLLHRYPRAQKDLLDRLASANFERLLRLHHQRTENADGTQTADNGAGSMDFSDSGIGTSSHTGTSHAATLMSYRQKNSYSVKIPPLSEAAKQGEPFECVACGGKVSFKNNSTWKKHLFMDLRPWVCHDIACSRGSEVFVSRQEWVNHLANGHNLNKNSQPSMCPLCQEMVQGSKLDVVDHLAAHLEETSLFALHATIDSDEDVLGDDAQGHATPDDWNVLGDSTSTDFRGPGDQYQGQFMEAVKVLSKILPPDPPPMVLRPITGRASSPNKGGLIHVCELCRPHKTFTRADHLRRHQLSHIVPEYDCKYPDCDRAFHRRDLLERHIQRHELEGDKLKEIRKKPHPS